MNKNKSAKLHLLRFLFLLPVLAFILVSFRKEIGNTLAGKEKQLQLLPVAGGRDTVPEVTRPNTKGYIINVKDKKGECQLVIKDKTGKEVKRLLLTEWNANAEKYEGLYGEIPPPPPPAAPDMSLAPTPPTAPDMSIAPTPPTAPAPVQLPTNVQKINRKNDKVTVWLKNGQKENYDLNNTEQKASFENKYGNFIPPPPSAEAIEQLSAPKNDEVKNVVVYQSGSNVPSKTITANLLIILNGEIISKAEMDNLNPESIASVEVLKGNNATALYGDKANEGAIIIKTKTGTHTTNNMTLNNGSISMKDSKALVILDGKELPSNREKLTGTFNVVTLNKEEAIKRYGDKGKNGVLELTTLK